jgi:hypothetical protein
VNLTSYIVATHVNITRNANNTISGGRTSHVGQLYFDQDLVDQVSKLKPYMENKMSRTSNKQDFLLGQSAANGADPIVEYILLGEQISQGIFAWINFGIDAKKTVPIHAATVCTTDGCKSSPSLGGIFDWLFGAFAGAPKGGISKAAKVGPL